MQQGQRLEQGQPGLPVQLTAAPEGLPEVPQGPEGSPWFAADQARPDGYQGSYNPQIVDGTEPIPVPVPLGPDDVPPPGPEEFVEYPEYVEEQLEPHEVEEFREVVYKLTWAYAVENDRFPEDPELAGMVAEHYGIQQLRNPALLQQVVPGVRQQIQQDMQDYRTP